ncbi:MAG: type IV toxin-antitoxin system AbiEi family antitoxin domain-containing protein [Nocardioidaceae bacterium]|nr:type IV toxin-antitoxin system AbiEi family antitoxin domain-containing protein [Nocardioidaceae bacterium]
MDLASHVTYLGGACRRPEIVARCGRSAVDRALRSGTLVRVARGIYALATASDAVKAAATYGGVISMRSAAQRHGWGQRLVPALPDVTFPRTHHVPRAARRSLVPHWSNIAPEDIVAGATSKRRTLVDCMRNLPLEEAVPIVDSAIRAGDITSGQLRALAASMRGRGRARAMAVAAMATSAAANAFESTLRAIASTVPGLAVEPQRPLRVGPGWVVQPDLVDVTLGIVIEAESFEWHGKSAALTRDCVRYNALSTLGYLVIRFSWAQVIHQPTYVVEVLSRAVERARGPANVARGPTDAVA